jgi:serine/threonine protein kinase
LDKNLIKNPLDSHCRLEPGNFLGFTAEVYLMIYKPSSENPIEVAVKNIQNMRFGHNDIKREIALISDCRHPNIVSYIGYFKDAQFDSLNLVMEYMPGGNLHEYLLERSNVIFDIFKT